MYNANIIMDWCSIIQIKQLEKRTAELEEDVASLSYYMNNYMGYQKMVQ